MESTEMSRDRMLKTAPDGRPFIGHIINLFSVLLFSLQLTTNERHSRSFPDSFTTNEAVRHLGSLRFSLTKCFPDPQDPSRFVYSTSTTAYSTTKDMAKAVLQQFADSRFIEDPENPGSHCKIKDRGVYTVTPKGLHVLERFGRKNGTHTDDLAHAFSSRPICRRLLHLSRLPADDTIIFSNSAIAALFLHFVGPRPNYLPNFTETTGSFRRYREQSKGVPLLTLPEKKTGKTIAAHQHCFAAVTAMTWLCEFIAFTGPKEAAELAAHFVRFGLIGLVSDKGWTHDKAAVHTVHGSAGKGAGCTIATKGEFRCTPKAIYHVTDEGRRLARWDVPYCAHPPPNHSYANAVDAARSPQVRSAEASVAHDPAGSVSKIHRRAPTTEAPSDSFGAEDMKGTNVELLKSILEEDRLRTLFREFLEYHLCERSLVYYLDVERLKEVFRATSSVVAAGSNSLPRPGTKSEGSLTMEKHFRELHQKVFSIYHTYLIPSSPTELGGAYHDLRNAVDEYVNNILTQNSTDGALSQIQLESAINVTQLHGIIQLYERVQTPILEDIARDWIPSFTQTPKFLALKAELAEEDAGFLTHSPIPLSKESTSSAPGTDEKGDIGLYMTIYGDPRMHRVHLRELPVSQAADMLPPDTQ